MIQNIKVDIVYYMTATDFEFEFNLGSCCHMRILNDKVKDKKSFVNSLARAVSRSQIIISCGPLFGEDGLISMVATAINHGLETVNNRAYGLSSGDKIEIIEGSVPLVTTEGYFGGCIIESGSQTIIVLTENRTIRKSIMKTLVHPYIEEISVMQSAERAPSGVIADMVKTPVSEKAEEKYKEETFKTETEDTDLLQSESEEDNVTDVKSEADTGDDAEDTQEEHNVSFDFTKEAQDITYGDIADREESFLKDSREDFIQEERSASKKTRRGINSSILIIISFLLLAVLALCYFVLLVPVLNGMTTEEYFSQIFGSLTSVVLV